MGIRTKFLITFLLVSIIPFLAVAYFTFDYSSNTLTHWAEEAKINQGEALRSIDVLREIIIISSFMFIIMITLITVFFVYSITGPIVNIASVIRKVRAGDLSTRALVLSKDEIGELAKGFNMMLDSLQEIHKNLEQKVHERTQQLEASNKDLESFTYSVSHDLRAPLRAIDGFSQILEEDYAPKFDDEGKRVIATIRKSTQQMGNLIDDLLAFSRLGRQAIKPEKVSMTKMVKNIFADLKRINPKRTIEFTISDLPDVRADTALMRQVWTNLLSNAIKYTKHRNVAKIIVGSTIKGKNTIYYVNDNGAGFNMKYVNKLFGVFQRLHSPQEFEGSGVGLAIIYRIVTKHGGTVWAEGEIEKGATFFFSLPKTNDKSKITSSK